MDDGEPYQITVTRIAESAPPCESLVGDAIRATLRRHAIDAAHIHVAIVDDDEIAALNRRHLRHDGPTDVLSFDLSDPDETVPRSADAEAARGAIEGDIVVSAQTAARESAARGHGPEAELALYAVHGALHLLGYDDHSRTGADRMHAIEDEVLTALGVGPVYGAKGG